MVLGMIPKPALHTLPLLCLMQAEPFDRSEVCLIRRPIEALYHLLEMEPLVKDLKATTMCRLLRILHFLVRNYHRSVLPI